MALSQTWDKFHSLNQSLCTFCSINLNIILIFLIFLRSPKKLGMYKYLMIYISLFEIIYSIWDLLAEPHVHSYGSAFVVFRNMKHSSLTRNEGFLLIVIYCGFFGFSLAIFGIHFIYRYGAINKNFWEKYLKGSKLCVLFSIPIIYFIFWGLVCYFFFEMNQERDDYMRSTILQSYDIEIEQTSYICVLFHPFDKNGQSYPDYRIFLAIGVCWVEIITSMWAVFYFGIICYCLIKTALRRSNQSSRKTKNLQQQLFQALVVQTCIPLILMYIPIAILFIFPMLNIDIGFTSSFVAITIAIYPAIDPLPNMFMIKSYRHAIFRVFKACISCTLSNVRNESCINQCAVIEMPKQIEMKIMNKSPNNITLI